MIDVEEIQAWCQTYLRGRPMVKQISNALSRMRNEEQVAECQSYALWLANGQRSDAAFIGFLGAAARLGLQFPDGRFRDVTAQHLLDWNNTRAYPSPLPRAGGPWPSQGEGEWIPITEAKRKVQQGYILRFLVHVMQASPTSASTQ